MATAYNSPGVVVSESVTPSVAPITSSPSIIALVGASAGQQTVTERVLLDGTTAVQLKYSGVDDDSVIVTSSLDGSTINPGNYVITEGTDPDATVTGDEPFTIARFGLPETAPTVGIGGTGALDGTYQYAVSFLNAEGETGIGPASIETAITAAGFNLTAIPLGPTGTTGRNIYRKKTSGTNADNVFHLVATLNDNTAALLNNEATTDAIANAASSPPTGIADGDTVVVSYDYTDQNYFRPTIFDNYSSIVDKYGAPFDANGNIDSQLSFAARILFLNGASELVVQAAKSSSQTDVEDALAFIENDPTIRIVVIADGSAATASALAAHVNKMNDAGYYRFGVAGRDGLAASVTADSLRSEAQGLNNQAVRLVSPTVFQVQNPVTRNPLNVGGQYLAAAIAGMYAARDVQIPLTRKSVAGFTAITDQRTPSELILDSRSGLLAIDDFGGTLRVRHDVTTAVGSISTRESSVVRAKFEMASRLKVTLDNGIVGLVAPPERATLAVQSVVIGVLEQLLLEQAISSYSNVTARIASGDPTTVQAEFEYYPSYPINNISVVFTINTTTGEFNLT